MSEVRPLTTEERQSIAAGRLLAARRFPYLATALFAMEPVAAPSLDTFAVDRRWRLYVGPSALTRWRADEVAAVLVHEVAHLLRAHAERGDRACVGTSGTPREWNIACDAAINDDLLAESVPLPKGCVTPATFGAPAHLLEEEYYTRLVADLERPDDRERGAPPELPDCGSGAHGRPRPWETSDEVSADVPGVPPHAEEIIRRRVAAAVKEAGTAPAGWQRWADDSSPSAQVDWRRLLRLAVRAPRTFTAGTLDPTWARPSRRDDPLDPLMRPGRRAPRLEIGVVIDTSGSMSDVELAAVLAEVDSVRRYSGARRIWVVSCDSRPSQPQRIARPADIRLTGGGGTDLRPAIELMATLRPRPDAVVVCTDGYTPWPRLAPREFDMVVATTDRPCPVPGVQNVVVQL